MCSSIQPLIDPEECEWQVGIRFEPVSVLLIHSERLIGGKCGSLNPPREHLVHLTQTLARLATNETDLLAVISIFFVSLHRRKHERAGGFEANDPNPSRTDDFLLWPYSLISWKENSTFPPGLKGLRE